MAISAQFEIFEKKTLLIISLFLFIFTASVHFTNAENQIFLENLPGLDGLANETQKAFKDGGDMNKPLRMYLNWLIQTSVVLGSILAVGLIIAGGVEYMTTGTFTGKSEGKERVTNAVLGFVFLISGYLIFQQINPKILQINLSNAGKIKMEVETGKWIIDGVPFDPEDTDDYEKIKDWSVRNGYDKERCVESFDKNSNLYWTDEDVRKKCEEIRNSDKYKDKADPKHGCSKKSRAAKWVPNWADPTITYCFQYNSGKAKEQNQCVKSLGPDAYCVDCGPNVENTCDYMKELFESRIVSKKYLEGAKTAFCAYEGGDASKLDKECLVGKEIDGSKYIQQTSVSCLKKDCQKYFDALKKKNSWPDSCSYKLVYKEYDKNGDSEFWIYTDKNTCK